MNRLAHRYARPAWAVLLALFVLASFAWTMPAWASPDDEPPPAPEEEVEEGAEAAEPLDADTLEKRLLAKPHTAVTTLGLRFVPAIIGIVLLILWYLERDKIRGGMLPPPDPVKTTQPFGVWMSIGLTLLAMALVPLFAMVFLAILFGWKSEAAVPMWATILASGLGSLPVAAFVVYRRRRFAKLAGDVVAVPAPPPLPTAYPRGDRGAPGTQPPPPRRAFKLGWWTLCVAGLVVFLVSVVWAVLMDGLGMEPVTQKLVQQVADPAAPGGDAWLIAIFGVLVAPFVEESIFRGMLYPAAKRAFGGGTRGMWLAAVLISLIFAAIHMSWYALLPLFALAMVLTWVFETTNSLAAVIVAHALHNLLSMIPLLLLRFFP